MSTEPTRGGKPHYCHNGHEEIRFSALACPLCVVLARVQELERELDGWKRNADHVVEYHSMDLDRIEELEREVARLKAFYEHTSVHALPDICCPDID